MQLIAYVPISGWEDWAGALHQSTAGGTQVLATTLPCAIPQGKMKGQRPASCKLESISQKAAYLQGPRLWRIIHVNTEAKTSSWQFADDILKSIFLYENLCFDFSFTDICYKGSNYYYVIIGSYSALAANRWQTSVSMAYRKIAIILLLKHWSSCSLALNPRFDPIRA